jgi:putative Holliday junction resolvase
MKILGLDIGDRRIGVAVVDTDVNVPMPLITLSNNRSFVNELKKLIIDHKIESLVVGMPLNLSGHKGEQVDKVMEVVVKIKAKLKTPIIFEDERLTSQTAAQRLRDIDYVKGDIDAVSAVIILEHWMARNG